MTATTISAPSRPSDSVQAAADATDRLLAQARQAAAWSQLGTIGFDAYREWVLARASSCSYV